MVGTDGENVWVLGLQIAGKYIFSTFSDFLHVNWMLIYTKTHKLGFVYIYKQKKVFARCDWVLKLKDWVCSSDIRR